MKPNATTPHTPQRQQVEGTVPPVLATVALSQWETHHKGQLPSPPPSSAPTPYVTTTPVDPRKEAPYADLARVRALVNASTALLVVRVILPSGATVRDGVEIDVAEQVRNLPQVG